MENILRKIIENQKIIDSSNRIVCDQMIDFLKEKRVKIDTETIQMKYSDFCEALSILKSLKEKTASEMMKNLSEENEKLMAML